MSVMFELQQVDYRYPDGRSGLQACSMSLRRAGRHAILGPNGSGKTTLLQHLNGLLRPAAGAVHVDGALMDYGRRGLQAVRQPALQEGQAAGQHANHQRQQQEQVVAGAEALAQRVRQRLHASVDGGQGIGGRHGAGAALSMAMQSRTSRGAGKNIAPVAGRFMRLPLL